MTIGIDASRAAREIKTGVETYSFALLGALRTVVPPEVRVFLYADTPKPDDFGELPANWEWRQIGRAGQRLWTQMHLSREIRRNPPDVLFVPAHVLPLIHPRRSVVAIHDASFMRAPQAYAPFARAYLRWSTAFAVARASRIIVPSEWTKGELTHFFGAREEQIVVIPHGIDREKYRPATEADIAGITKRYLLRSTFYVLIIGRVEEKKNLQALLKAAAILRKRGKPIPEIVFAGVDGFGAEKIRRAAEELGLSDRVRFLGFVPESDLPALIASAGALAVPGALEGFGLPVLQGFASGVPVVASRAGALPEVAGDAALLVPPDDAEAWADALGTILTDGTTRDRLRAAATARLSAFSWHRCAEESWKTIAGTIQNPVAGRSARSQRQDFQKHHDVLAVMFIPVISPVVSVVLAKIFLRIPPFKFFLILLCYTIFLILGYIYLSYKQRISWINKHAVFVTLLGILIPIILFWQQQVVSESKLFSSYEVSLKEENNRNISHLQSVVSDLENDPRTTFWRDFSTDKYKQYWDYIALNYSQECKNLYAHITIQLDVLNNMNQMRRELILVPNGIFKDMLDAASNTQPVFNEIVGKCQKF